MNKIENAILEKVEYVPHSLYEKTDSRAYEWYKPILSELIINPILGCAKVLIGIAHMVTGVVLTIFGALHALVDLQRGLEVVRHGVGTMVQGAFSGVVPGLVLMTPILGTIHIHLTLGKAATFARWQSAGSSLPEWTTNKEKPFPDHLTSELCEWFSVLADTGVSQLDTIQLPDGWISTSRVYEELLFVNESEKIVVITHRSTPPELPFFTRDWSGNQLRCEPHSENFQRLYLPNSCFYALQFSNAIRAVYGASGYTIIETGRSYGKFLAELNTYIFSAQGVSLKGEGAAKSVFMEGLMKPT